MLADQRGSWPPEIDSGKQVVVATSRASNLLITRRRQVKRSRVDLANWRANARKRGISVDIFLRIVVVVASASSLFRSHFDGGSEISAPELRPNPVSNYDICKLDWREKGVRRKLIDWRSNVCKFSPLLSLFHGNLVRAPT